MAERHKILAELDILLPLWAESIWVKLPGVREALHESLIT